MAIYHCTISNVSRGGGASACATLAYITAKDVYEERTGQTYSYGRSERVVTVGTVLPPGAPDEWQDPAKLCNAIENYETAENARTGKKIEVALPREFTPEQRTEVVEEYIGEQLSPHGYAAVYAIHTDPSGNNPHAHILAINRPIDPQTGAWVKLKTKKDYALDENGQRVPLIDPATGAQKLGKRNERLWKRVTVEQNPLDKKEMLDQLRKGWADCCNSRLDPGQRIDHRSNADRGLEEIPSIHIGYAESAERLERNRQIAEANELLEQVRAEADRAEDTLEPYRDLTVTAEPVEPDRVKVSRFSGRVTIPAEDYDRLVEQANAYSVNRSKIAEIPKLEAALEQRDQEVSRRERAVKREENLADLCKKQENFIVEQGRRIESLKREVEKWKGLAQRLWSRIKEIIWALNPFAARRDKSVNDMTEDERILEGVARMGEDMASEFNEDPAQIRGLKGYDEDGDLAQYIPKPEEPEDLTPRIGWRGPSL